MKKNVRKLFALAMIVLMGFACIGCSLVSVNEEKDRAQVVATIGGDMQVLKGEYIDKFNELLANYKSYGSDPTTNAKTLQSFQDAVLDTLVKTKLMYYRAAELGLDTFTEEDEAYIKQKVEEQKESIMNNYREWAAEDFKDDPTVDIEQIAQEYLLEQVEQYGMDIDEYWASAEEEQRDLLINDRLLDYYTSDMTVEDDEIQTWYEDAIKEQTEKFNEKPQLYKSYQEYFEKYQKDPIVVVPEGFKRFKHIQIVSDNVIGSEYNEKKQKMKDLQNELGPLVLEDETTNAARIAEIREEYAALKAETEAMYAEHYEQAKLKCEDLWKQLMGGADFHKLMMENTKDSNILDYEMYQEKGILMSDHASASDFSDAAKKAAMALTEIGDFTKVVSDDDGYHLFQYVGDEKAGVRELDDDLREVIHAQLLKDKRDDKWSALMEEWKEDDKLVILNRNATRDVKGDS